MSRIIGLTGGIGSGKTTVANYLKSHGVPVYIADEEAKMIMNTPVVVSKVKEVFGEEMIDDDKVDRQKLAQLVFADVHQLQKLNAIIHPLVKEHFEQWLREHQQYPFVVKEAAILFESGSYKDCDQIILVTAPEADRIQRVVKRDAVTEDLVLARMNNQWSEEQKMALSDYIIHNISLENTREQVDVILDLLKKQQD
ncbi:dephospho-CoA kinase [Flavobacterium sp.]|uniref:dephospho-CoA kinase n=1 Tax=Flavobacterium sp. TaxID=239 RepID=UPI002FDED0E1